MEMCRQRMTACPGGPDLMRAYEEHLYQGVPASDAMRRAWAETATARQAADRGREHHAAPNRDRLNVSDVDPASLPIAAYGPARSGAGRGPIVRPSARTAAVEAARLLGAPEATMPQLRDFQARYGTAADRDGATLARQWLADTHRRGLINQDEHDAWRDVVQQARRSPEHVKWRIDRGLDHQPVAQPASIDAATENAAPQPVDDAGRITAATADHLAGHAAQHHRSSDRHLGRAVDDPQTTHVDEQDLYRQRAYTERKVAEVYDALATPSPTRDGMAARAAAARPSPATAHRAAPPPSLAGKRAATVLSARPSPPRTPMAGRG
jgi:hypothetical protein